MVNMSDVPWALGSAGPAPVAERPLLRHNQGMGTFHGPLTVWQDRLLSLNLDGEWEEQPNDVWKFRCRNRSAVLWSATKGTVWFDGPPALKDALRARVETCLASTTEPAPMNSNKTIFIVHGRDTEAKDQLELVLHRLGLDPFILQNTGGGGDTLIEALEKMIGKVPSSAFGIVLLTPDDMGYLKDEKPEDAKPRARQNVILEMGMLLSSLTRKRCAILQKGFVEQPSNMGGIVYIPFNVHVREAVPKLLQRLQEAGFKLDPAQIGVAQA